MNPPPDVEDTPSTPLTKDEIKAVRRIIIADDRARWFWSLVRISGAWAAGVLAFFFTVGKPLFEWTKGWFK